MANWRMSRSSWLLVTALGVVISGSVGAFAGAQFAEAEPDDVLVSWSATEKPSGSLPQTRQATPTPEVAPTLDHQENARGLTYGSGSVSDLDEAPDLVLVEATNGKLGYVYHDELLGPTFTSPQEAVEYSREQAEKGEGRVLDVYETDGETIIGEFVLSPGKKSTG